ALACPNWRERPTARGRRSSTRHRVTVLALSQNQPQVLRREQSRVDRIDERRLARNARPFRPFVHGAHFIDIKPVLSCEQRQRGRMSRREMCWITPEFRSAHEERFRVRRFYHQQSAAAERARGLSEKREERFDRKMFDDVQ